MGKQPSPEDTHPRQADDLPGNANFQAKLRYCWRPSAFPNPTQTLNDMDVAATAAATLSSYERLDRQRGAGWWLAALEPSSIT